jgi:hypothetical protein
LEDFQVLDKYPNRSNILNDSDIKEISKFWSCIRIAQTFSTIRILQLLTFTLQPQILLPPPSTPPPTTLTPALTSRGRHAPTLQRGYHCWDDGSFDRSHAKLGEPDASKFTIKLPSRKIDRKEVGGYAKGKGAIYGFPNKNGWKDEDGHIAPFDWNNPGHVKKLHQWREQVFRRRIGGVRPTRVPVSKICSITPPVALAKPLLRQLLTS